jgi:hypothetical protein
MGKHTRARVFVRVYVLIFLFQNDADIKELFLKYILIIFYSLLHL